MPTCFLRESRCQHEHAVRLYGFGWEPEIARWWRAGERFEEGDRVRMVGLDGWELECTTAGTTGGRPPRIRPVDELEVPDGSLIWTVRPRSNDSLRGVIVASEWEAHAGITLTDEEIRDQGGVQQTLARIAGEQRPEPYEITNRVTFSNGDRGVAVLLLTVER